MRRFLATILPLAGVLLTAAACGDEPASAPEPPKPSQVSTTNGSFAAPGGDNRAVTYDPAVVPAGATATVTVAVAGKGTEVTLNVTGMVPNRAYGAHLHVKPCGADGTAAGPHHQHQTDPAAAASPPSVDPSFANPVNEVWLDFTADGSGAARVTAAQPWTFGPGQSARSLVVHAQQTQREPGRAGTAGPRAACLTLPA
ncbi:hypothetical protein Val02_64900 [Virgisporangium aliadipatigenens]|uniref:Superoxide dismutase copper/zinc binding domain-containing protein n=1 Tax=Virgisporangium aliadipatigenens TaxID=741659 RepID=A0A8J3YQ39_9ACTN|nr:superoxide dismutase family protein [Virgisporangium aliadipatigenens]GIJ49604.1 hypothetical protein Val02_64900 [Virgisporangium aliadipatigenens]